MFFNRNSFGKVDSIRRIILDGDNKRSKSKDKKRRAPRPFSLRLENLEERALLSVVPPFVDAGADQNAAPAMESSYVTPTFAVPDLSAAIGEGSTLVVTTLDDVVSDSDGVLSLREALSKAEDGDTITFAQSGSIILSGTQLEITKSITIDAMSVWNAESNAPGVIVDGDAKSRVFYVTGEDVDLKGLEITNGKAAENYLACGGGIFVSGGVITIENSVISNNNASSYGGGIFTEPDDDGKGVEITIKNSSITDNTSRFGGGISASSGAITIENSVISGNNVNWGGGGIFTKPDGSGNGVELVITNCYVTENSAQVRGGGISASGSKITIENSNFVSNGGGGGIYAESELTGLGNVVTVTNCVEVTITNSTISGNSGGGISASGVLVTIDNCEISDNTIGGGISIDPDFDENSSELTITNSVISGNTASSWGGGIRASGGVITIENCMISGNSTGSRFDGGGIYANAVGSANGAELTVTNSVISGNSGGGITAYGGEFFTNEGETINVIATVTIANSTIAGNAGSGIKCSGDSINLYNTIVSQNLNGDLTSSDSSPIIENCLIEIDPGFAAPPVFIDGNISNLDSLDLSLSPTSLAIDRGSNDYCGWDYDIVGASRIVASLDSSPTVDIGAYEYQEEVVDLFETYTGEVTTNEDICDPTDGVISLREALFYAEPNDTIFFDPSLDGSTIKLDGSSLSIFKNLTVDASSLPDKIIIDADKKSRVLSTTVYSHCTFDNLVFTNGYTTGSGGGISASSGEITFKNCSIIGNMAKFFGGGICIFDSAISFENSVIFDNTGANGGGVAAKYNTTLAVINSSISGNSASCYGGGIYTDNDGEESEVEITIVNSSISNNAASSGGGIQVHYSDKESSIKLTATNSSVSDNSAFEGGTGGGVFVYSGRPMLTFNNCTISGNTASRNGLGVDIRDGTIEFYNSIIAKNNPTNNSYEDIWSDSSAIVSAYNTLSSYVSWSNETPEVVNYDYDESLPLFVDAENGDYRLANNSQAIDKGNNRHVSTETDLRGLSRVYNDVVDLGAYEYQYDTHDLAAVISLGLTSESEGVVWDADGRLVGLTYADPEITSIDLTYCEALEYLDVSGCSNLTSLYCSNDALVSLDVSNCENLAELDCGYNDSLASLNMSGCSNLTKVWCYYTALESLDFSNCPNLTLLSCCVNGSLASLNVSNCSNLTTLLCHSTNLTSLDLSDCESLQSLTCNNTLLTSLDLSNSVNLNSLRCSSNQESILLNRGSDVSVTITSSINWNYLDAVDKNGDDIEASNEYGTRTFSVSSDCAFPVTITYYKDDAPVGTTTIDAPIEYNEHDLAAIEELGLEATSEGVVWNDEGRIVELVFSDSTITSVNITSCEALEKLDVSGCSNLQYLYCDHNALTSLDISGLENLTTLSCEFNALKTLNVSSCVNLTELSCGYNSLTSLDVSECTNLVTLYCYYNSLTSLDVSKCSNLVTFYCHANELISLNVSLCEDLTNLSCSYSTLTSLDVSDCANLEFLDCYCVDITALDLSNNPKLNTLYFSYNMESVLLNRDVDVSIGTPVLWNVDAVNVVDGNESPLESTINQNFCYFEVSDDIVFPLTVSYYQNDSLVGATTIKHAIEYNAHDLAAIEALGLTEDSEGVVWNDEGRLVELTYSNPTATQVSLTECAALEKLDVSGCVNLKTLNCYNNALTSLDFSGCANLQALTCYKNALTSLDLSKCTTLTYLYCAFNELTELDLSKCENLTNLLCGYNKLSSLDASCCANLGYLGCYANELTSLDVTGLSKLTGLSLSANPLTSLDLSGCVALTNLQCDGNELTSLDLSMCEDLTTLYCNGNALTTLDLLNQHDLQYLRFSSDTESVLLARDAEVSIELPASTNWNSLKVVDVNDEAIETTYNNEMRVFNVSPGRAYPITIAYSQNDAPVGTTTINADPAAPTNLVVGEFSHKTRSITVSWTDNSTNETRFLVQYSTDEENWTDVSVSADVTSATLSELAFDATYFVRVAATNDVGVSTFASGSLTTPLAMPESLRVVGFDEKNGLLVVSWGAAANQGNGYLVEESTDNGATWTPVAQTSADETDATIPCVEPGGSFMICVSALYATGKSDCEYAQVWNLANHSAYKAFALTSPTDGEFVLNGVNKDGSYAPLETGAYASDFYLCILGKKQKQEEFTIASDAASRSGRIDFVDSGTNNTITINATDGNDFIVIGTEIVETTEEFAVKNPYDKLLEYYARQYAELYGDNSAEYSQLKAQYDKAYKSLSKKVKTIKTTWGTISIEGGANVRFIGAKTATVNAGDGNDVVKVDSLGFGYVVSGGEGDDRLDFSDATGAVKVNLGSTSAQSAIAKDKGKLKLTDSFKTFVGSVYADTITGSSQGATIIGNGGSDKITLVGGDNVVTATGERQTITVKGTGTFDIALTDATKSTIKASGVKKESFIKVIADGDQISFTGGSSAIDVNITGDGAVVKNSNTIDYSASVVVIGNNAKITTGKGADYVKVVGDSATVNVGDGKDEVLILGANSIITLGNGDDKVETKGECQTITVKGTGNYTITLADAIKSTIKASGVNKTSTVKVKASGRQISFTGGSSAIDVDITGDDAVVKNSNASDYSAKVVVTGDNAQVTTGKGDDDVNVKGDSAVINVGDGDDSVNVDGENSNVTLGKGDNELIVNGVVIVPRAGGSGAILDDDFEFAGLWFDGIDALSELNDPGQLLTAQPVKLDGAQENDRKELDKVFASLNENWDVANELDPTLDLLDSQLEPKN